MPALETGIIAMWFGSLASIPAGFVLCDGTNDTPDLRDSFVIGAGDTYAVDDTGGVLLHQHGFTGDGHTHSIPAGTEIAAGSGFDDASNLRNVTGTTENTNHLPPYHSLAYIMKT